MKKLLIVGLGVVLMGMQVNVLAATCATEKKEQRLHTQGVVSGTGNSDQQECPFSAAMAGPGAVIWDQGSCGPASTQRHQESG